MPLPQDIRPVFQDIQDTLVRSDAPWIEQSPISRVKVLWVGRETGTWASLHHWKKGYVAPPHKHLAGAHAYVLSGKLQVRDGVLNAGDYVYEPSGILHDETTALEDTTYLFICNGAVLFFDENGFTRYTNWEVMEKLRAQAEAGGAARRGRGVACPCIPARSGLIAIDDQPGAALVGQIRPEPFERHDQAIAEADQKIDMHKAPGEPAEPAAQPEPAKIRDRLAPANYSHAADVAIPEGPGFGSAGEPGCDHARDIGALLLRNGRDPRQGPARPSTWAVSPMTEYLAMAGQRQVRADDHAAGAVAFGTKPASGRRRRPRRPPRSRFGSRSFRLPARPRRRRICVMGRAEPHFDAKAGRANGQRWPLSAGGKTR